MSTTTTPGYWYATAWRGYGNAPLPTPERGRMVLAGDYRTVIAEGSGDAVLAVASLYGYGERDFMRCVQDYGNPDVWCAYELRRLTWVPPETTYHRSADEFDASDAARVEYDEDGHAGLRWSL